ncbi:MAG: hypothetical protein FJ125_06475 [Deltaproteobacteria bacterium]|nr:hypothetical protein [Deltaproteobacteria bacterium]
MGDKTPRTQHETSGLSRTRPFWFGLAVLLLAAGITVSILVLGAHAVQQVDRVVVEKARTIARTVVDALRGVVRYGPDQEGRISAILDEVSRDPEVIAVGIVDARGRAMAMHGAASTLPDLATLAAGGGEELLARESSLVLLAPFQVADHAAQAGCRCAQLACAGAEQGFALLVPGSYRLVLAVDRNVAGKVRRSLLLVAGLALTTVLILLLVVTRLVRATRERERLVRQVAVEAQKRQDLESLNLLAAGLAHETKNPLASIRGFAQLLHEQKPDEQTAMLIGEVDRAHERLEEFLSFARRRRPDKGPIELGGLARGTVALLQPDAEIGGIALTLRLPAEPVVVDGDAAQLKELLFNLILNGLQASARGGRVDVVVAHRRGGASIAVRDAGRGIRREDLPRVFEPYFTTREHGSGLGLAIARRIAEEHGGELVLESEPGRGTTARLELPCPP